MQFKQTKLNDVCLIEPELLKDDRGRFMRAWCAQEFTNNGIEFIPIQANMGFSEQKGTIRGMHFQKAPALEAKLVRCTRGAIFDVVIDLRPDSSTYSKWYGVELNAENGWMLYVPQFCAHGCQSLEASTEIYYLTSAYYAPNLSSGIRYDDPFFDIQWPLAVTKISKQDRNWPFYKPIEV